MTILVPRRCTYADVRYYDSVIRQFISSDTIVPDPGKVFAYNRYMYVLGNPLNLVDPSGHCATNSNGEPDESDADCWRFARTIANMWDDTDYWQGRYGDVSVWTEHMAPSGLEAGFFANELDIFFQSEAGQQWLNAKIVPPSPPQLGYDPSEPCDIWDCPAIMLDLASLGLSVVQTGAAACAATGVGAPVCGSGAAYLTAADVTLNVAAIGYETGQYMKGDGTAYDLSATLADSAVKPALRAVGIGASVTPGVGIVYDMGMLLYDVMIDPIVSTPGAPVGVK